MVSSKASSMVSSNIDTDPAELRIHAERIKAVFHQANTAAITVWVCGLIMCLAPNESLDKSKMLTWFSVVTLCCISRLVCAWLFKRRQLQLEDYQRWGWAYAFLVFLTALVLGSSLFVLATPDNQVHQLFIMSVLVGLGVGVTQVTTTYVLLGHLYNVPVMSALFLKCMMTGGLTFYAFGATTAIYSVMMFVVGTDNAKRFTENLRLRFEIAQKRDEAEQANLAKTKFLAAASHDIRQPLHALTLFTGLLKDSTSKSESMDIMQNIDESLEGVKGIFDSLLDFSKLDAGTINLQEEHFPLSKIISKIENEYKHEAREKGLSISTDASEEYAYTDPTLLYRILSNLVSNAIRYTEEGAVSVTCEKQGNRLLIEVRDSGIGIAPEHQEEVFGEFVQLNNPQRDRSQGLGLGLSIVKGLTELMEIELRMESEEQVGTCFVLEIPLGEKPRALEPALEPALKPSQGLIDEVLPSMGLDGLSVVLIDDESQIREATLRLLANWHCQAKAFESCAATLQFLSDGTFVPQVILADYRLEDNLTGLEAIDDINSFLGRSIPAAIITGDTAPDRLIEAEASGHTLMHKPVQPMQLRSYLTKIKNEISSLRSSD